MQSVYFDIFIQSVYFGHLNFHLCKLLCEYGPWILPALLSQPAIDEDVTDEAVDVLLQKSRSSFDKTATSFFQDLYLKNSHFQY